MSEYGPLSYEGLPPASGAWREADPAGERRFAEVGDLVTESGAVIPGVTVAYETWGTLNDDRSNAVYICHALTGDSHVAGSRGSRSSHRRVVARPRGPRMRRGHGRVVRRLRERPGRLPGHHWPVVPGPRRPAVGKQVPGGDRARHGRGGVPPDRPARRYRPGPSCSARRWVACGSSSGWSVTPTACAEASSSARPRAVTADQIGTHAVQIDAIIADPAYRGGDYYDAPDGEGPHVGMGIARRIAHLTYRMRDRARPAVRARSAGRRGSLRRRPVRRRSRTSITTPTSSPGGSTPTPTWRSPGR